VINWYASKTCIVTLYNEESVYTHTQINQALYNWRELNTWYTSKMYEDIVYNADSPCQDTQTKTQELGLIFLQCTGVYDARTQVIWSGFNLNVTRVSIWSQIVTMLNLEMKCDRDMIVKRQTPNRKCVTHIHICILFSCILKYVYSHREWDASIWYIYM
jgi:hypothetical protein